MNLDRINSRIREVAESGNELVPVSDGVQTILKRINRTIAAGSGIAHNPLMNADDMREAREALGLTQSELAKLLRLSDPRAIRHYEGGTRDISGPISLLMEIFQEQPKLIKKYTTVEK